jgi:hypothetical protein
MTKNRHPEVKPKDLKNYEPGARSFIAFWMTKNRHPEVKLPTVILR